MRFVEGTDLRALIARAGAGSSPGAPRGSSRRSPPALDAAHARGLVHRDVKPATSCSRQRRASHAYLTDFGLDQAARASRAG